MQDDFRLRFRKYQLDLEHLFIQKSGAEVASRSDSGTRGPDDGPRSHQTLYSTSEKNALELEIADRAALPRISRCSRRDRAGNKTGWEHEVSVCYALGRSVCAQRHRVLPACFALELEASESLTEAQRRWCWGRSRSASCSERVKDSRAAAILPEDGPHNVSLNRGQANAPSFLLWRGSISYVDPLIGI